MWVLTNRRSGGGVRHEVHGEGDAGGVHHVAVGPVAADGGPLDALQPCHLERDAVVSVVPPQQHHVATVALEGQAQEHACLPHPQLRWAFLTRHQRPAPGTAPTPCHVRMQ